MTKRLVYILTLLLYAAGPPSAKAAHIHLSRHFNKFIIQVNNDSAAFAAPDLIDTNRVKQVPQNRMEVLKIKEVAKPKHQSKPEKVVVPDTVVNKKAARQRRPDGLERPPEIPRRNN